eukprot:m.47852 g.47852  ORF g.47852 m.47852 type:complete len:304 (-) comp47625_c0_seq2:1021-1932(-)
MFKLSQAARASTRGIKTVAVIGSGLMGSGIAQVVAHSGRKVVLVDTSDKSLHTAHGRIQTSLTRVFKKQFPEEKELKHNVERVLSHLSMNTNVEKAVQDIDLVIEAIPERLELKHELFTKIDPVARPTTIFASNTSSIRIESIASVVKRKDRFCGLHFFNPVPMMKLLEVVQFSGSSAATIEAVSKFGQDIGKHVVHCKDTPGFIVNRLLVPMMLEAIRMVERGDATVADVDAAMKLGAGHPMGPFELTDYVGLDTTAMITHGWKRDYPDQPLLHPVALLDAKVKEGKLGNKSGEGFYKATKK